MRTTLHERLARARRLLTRAGLTERDAAVDVDVLARHALGWDRGTLVARWHGPPPPSFDDAFEALVARRVQREPVALITGLREFWGLDFRVTPDVLVPRPETELILEVATIGQPAAYERIADVGTGSGCLAVCLACEFPRAAVEATDVSAAALAVARGNAERHGVSRIRFAEGDLFAPLSGSFDLIVSNPPYVPEGADLPPEVACFEPPAALFAGPDGLAVLRRLIRGAGAYLAADGRFVVEFGFGQADAVRGIARAAGFREVMLHSDLQGIPRVAAMSGR